MGQFRIVRSFGNGITPSTEKAYRVESAHLMTEHDALSLLDSIKTVGEFRLTRSFGNGTTVSTADSFGVENVNTISERDALALMRDLNSPYEGSRYLANRTSVLSGTRVSNEDRQQQQG